jgi:alpha-ketoglutarate-dependent taurine dioxygenase
MKFFGLCNVILKDTLQVDNIIRMNGNVGAPDFSRLSTNLNISEYTVNCADFSSRDAMEAEIKARFSENGMVLLKNTGFTEFSELKYWGALIIKDFSNYEGGAFVRKKLSDVVYNTGTEPDNLFIHPHNEMAYLPTFPRRIIFGSKTSLKAGGETIMSDNVAVTHAMLQSDVGKKLKDKGVIYIRNLTSRDAENKVVYKHWQDVFDTDDKEQVNSFSRGRGWNVEWKENDRCEIHFKTDAYEYNTTLNDNLLFTPVGAHGMHFDNWFPYNTLPFDQRPGHMVYGDGVPFTDKEIEFFLRIYDSYSFPIYWQPGWIAILDNERWAHARPPFSLQENETREIGVIIGDMKDRIGARF